MPRRLQTLALLLTLLPLAAVAHAKDDGHDKDRAVITADYILDDTSAESKDAVAFVSDLTDNFTAISEKGVTDIHNKAEALAQAKQLFSVANKITSHTVITDIQFTKEGAIVTSTLDVSFVVIANGQTHTIADKSTGRDEWVKSGDAWLQNRTTATVTRHFLDGKPTK